MRPWFAAHLDGELFRAGTEHVGWLWFPAAGSLSPVFQDRDSTSCPFSGLLPPGQRFSVQPLVPWPGASLLVWE
jgi:hypothetical protein